MGEVFAGRYELLEPIAMGGMGTVWTVRDHTETTDQVKVAKILQQSDAASLLRFVREQSVRIDHRHVVTPQSWAGMDERVLFTMPLVRGGSVADLLRQYGALPPRWVSTLLEQTLEALDAVHAAEIVHRDVKPANLLLEPTGRARPHLRLTDFGIAAGVDQPRMTRAATAIGTPGYMAPEQEHGADPDPRQDLYAVGVVGLEMLSGVRPPAQGPLGDLPLPGAENGADDGADERVGRLVELLRRATSSDAADRPASASGMRAELVALDVAGLPAEPGERIEVADRFTALVPTRSGSGHLGSSTAAPTRGPSTPAAPIPGQPTPGLSTGQPPSAPARPVGRTIRGVGLLVLGALLVVLAGILALS